MSYCTMKKVAQQAQGKYISNDAIRAIIDAGGDVIQGALAVGMAMGKHGERERRKPKGQPLLDMIMDKTPDMWERNGPMNAPFTHKPYKRAAYAVKREYGSDEPLTEAICETQYAAYQIGFATAMQLIRECDSLLDG